MNSLCPGEENIYITDKYYLLLNEISEDFIKYINNYKLATNDYLKKIVLNQEKYSPKLLDNKTQLKDVDSNHIKSLAAIIPKVVEQQIINIEFFVEGFDEKYNRFEKLLKDKSLEYLVIQNSFKDVKNELIKKYREIDKIKASFMTNINMVEDTIHKFYMKQNTNNKKKTNKLNFTQIDTGHDLNFISTEEQINNSIQKTKRIEDEYKSNIISVKDLEKNYIEATENTKEKSREVISEIGNNLKEFISDCMLYLRNSFKIPLSEIDTYLNELVDTDEYTKIDRLIKSSYKKEISLKPINTEK